MFHIGPLKRSKLTYSVQHLALSQTACVQQAIAKKLRKGPTFVEHKIIFF